MSHHSASRTSRRTFLKDTGRVAAVSALAMSAIPRAYAGPSNTIHIALVGCGGRGTGAASTIVSPTIGSVSDGISGSCAPAGAANVPTISAVSISTLFIVPMSQAWSTRSRPGRISATTPACPFSVRRSSPSSS